MHVESVSFCCLTDLDKICFPKPALFLLLDQRSKYFWIFGVFWHLGLKEEFFAVDFPIRTFLSWTPTRVILLSYELHRRETKIQAQPLLIKPADHIRPSPNS